jgi:hypothetical protein
MLRTLSAEARYRLFLCLVSLIGIAFALAATSKYGAGVSSDAARNLSTADSLLAGKGFIDMVGSPLVLWPPLYPLLLAGLSRAVGLSTFEVAWYLNVLLFGLNLWVAGWWLFTLFRVKPYYAVAGVLVMLFSRSLLRIHANVASEPLFESLILVCLLASGAYLRDGSSRYLWAMCVAAGLAALQRYPGVVLLGVGAAVILRREGLVGTMRGVVPWLLSILPIAGWGLFHNIPASGSPFGPREWGAMLPLQNMGLSLTKILWWFVPRWGVLDWILLRPWLPLCLMVVLLVFFTSRREWLSWLRALCDDRLWPALLFGGVYFVLLAFTVVTAEHLDLTSDRFYIILLPIVLALAFTSLDALFLWRPRGHRRIALVVLACSMIVWSIYPVYAVQAYLRQAIAQGEPTNYNIANSAQFREMSVVKAAERILQADPGALVYSNYVNIAWFIFAHPVKPLPFGDQDLSTEERLSALKRDYPTWPDRPGYLVWFVPNQYHHIVGPDELAAIADLDLLFEDETGQVYAVKPQGE